MMNTTDSFGLYIKSLRTSIGMTIDELSIKSGVSRPYISKMENSKVGKPSSEILSKLAPHLNTTYENLKGILEKDSKVQPIISDVDDNPITGVIDELLLKKAMNIGKEVVGFTIRFAHADNKRLELIGDALDISKQEFISKVVLAALMEAELKLGYAYKSERGVEYTPEYMESIRSN